MEQVEDVSRARHIVTARSSGLYLEAWAHTRSEAEEIAQAFYTESPEWIIDISEQGAELVPVTERQG